MNAVDGTDAIIFEDHKGGLYEWLGTAALDSNPSITMVIYKCLDTNKVRTCPLTDWQSSINHRGVAVPRFKQVG